MKEQLTDALRAAVRELLEEAGDTDPPPAFSVDVPRQSDHGDFACNAAMVLAKRLRQSPRAIAEALVARLGDGGGLVARSEIAGPGFLNLWLSEDRWQDVLVAILEAGGKFGHSQANAGQKVQVEFVSANPTGPLSVGHGRQAILGDCVARLLAATGADVTREYYFNNGGRQMRVLGQSRSSARYLEQLGRAAAAAGRGARERRRGRVARRDRDGLAGPVPRATATRATTSVTSQPPSASAKGEGWVDEPGATGLPGRSRDAPSSPTSVQDPRLPGIRLRRLQQRERTSTTTARSTGCSTTCARRGLVYERRAPSGCAPRNSVSSATACS